MRLLIFFILCISIFSCKQDETPSHIGQWEMLNKDKLEKILILSDDTATVFDVYINDCDTFFNRDMQFEIIRIQSNNNNTTNLTVAIEKDSMIWSLEINNKISGILHFNNDSIPIKKSNHNLVLDSKKRKLRNLSYTIEYEILQTQRDYEKLKEDIELSNNAYKLIQYIDTLKIELMNSYELNYSEIKCWANLDSLASYKTASNFMIGSEPANPKDEYLSGLRLENNLLDYFKTLPKNVDIKTIFPYYKDGEFYYFYDGVVENWAVHKFFHITLGKTIIELNKIQLNIIQLERISKNN